MEKCIPDSHQILPPHTFMNNTFKFSNVLYWQLIINKQLDVCNSHILNMKLTFMCLLETSSYVIHSYHTADYFQTVTNFTLAGLDLNITLFVQQ